METSSENNIFTNDQIPIIEVSFDKNTDQTDQEYMYFPDDQNPIKLLIPDILY